MKFFLSHSSADKHIVEKVYEQLGASLCHYDVATFDNTSFLPEQIYEALNESTHFVLFASRKALESSWVKGELKRAFSLWMKAQIRHAMVFLIEDGERSHVPEWLQDYVIIEHPSAQHISCRILSAFDDWESKNGNEPPFYRYQEIIQLEKHVSVEPRKLPTTLMLCGTDGYGRKQLVNELFKRRYPGIARRKLFFSLKDHDSDVNLYRQILGLISLLSPIELSEKTKEYLGLASKERYALIASHILEATRAGQALYLDVGSVGLDDSGRIASWLEDILKELPRNTYPRLILFSARKPIYLSSQLTEFLYLQKIEPLPRDESKLLFSWWLTKLEVTNQTDILNEFIEYVDGRPKSIEMAARTLATIDPSQIAKHKNAITNDIQTQATSLLKVLENDTTSNIALAIVAYSGYISEVDLIESIKTIPEETEEKINQSLGLLLSYGFILQDSISIKIPGYLTRAARRLLNEPNFKNKLNPALEHLISANQNIDHSKKTSVSIIEDYCIASLRKGQHSIIGVESLILPSQCFRLAKEYYDNRDYEESFKLCETAYRNRLALTEESSLEVLRFKGLSAARLNKQTELNEVLNSFSQHRNSVKSTRLKAFIKGFNLRLSGEFDNALKELEIAHNSGGKGDIHILRELSFINYISGDLKKAEELIRAAYRTAENNSYIIQMLIRILIDKYKPNLTNDEHQILGLIEKLESSQNHGGKAAYLMRAELYYATGNAAAAKGILNIIPQSTPAQLLTAKILIKEKKYPDARSLLLKMKGSVLGSQEGQRQTSMPEICSALIEAATGISAGEGINELERNKKHLPEKLTNFWKELLTQELSFTQTAPTQSQLRILQK
ncbi:toll/interleukin-1 receptor domain-containing protein [Pseudomonas sp. MOIL14HWK12:I2]|uniref:toll/interleukin-1 receptor domain-containing protein n=1 Tax=Pseudomonas sp. MOIL14HWK12:I2 TaxID=1033994 RepID=UPI000426E167|nr:toll/interleukin-1 receptor domain-containing protein [Pseudomonas sp. MOIL14HWK12:I2]